MSRIGKIPVSIPKGVEIKISQRTLSVKGPKGTLSMEIMLGLEVAIQNDEVLISLAEGSEHLGNFHGLYRALIGNMVKGATQGFEKKLQMVGVGFRAAVQGDLLDLQLGYSHPTKLHIPKGVTVAVEKNTLITVTGIDKQVVGQFAAEIREMRPPEPYQGKGIRYENEYVRRKAGKAGKKQ